MAELVDAADSKSVFERSGSSSLPRGTNTEKKVLRKQGLFFVWRKVEGCFCLFPKQSGQPAFHSCGAGANAPPASLMPNRLGQQAHQKTSIEPAVIALTPCPDAGELAGSVTCRRFCQTPCHNRLIPASSSSKPTFDFLPDVRVVVLQPTNQHFIELATKPVSLSRCQPFLNRFSEYVGVETRPYRRHRCNEIGKAHRRDL